MTKPAAAAAAVPACDKERCEDLETSPLLRLSDSGGDSGSSSNRHGCVEPITSAAAAAAAPTPAARGPATLLPVHDASLHLVMTPPAPPTPPAPAAGSTHPSAAACGALAAAAAAVSVTTAAPPLRRRLCEECRTALRPRVVGRFLRLGIPGGLSMAFEAGCFDICTVLAGRLGPVATASHAALLSLVTLTYLACPFALATAGAIRVGNSLGAGQPDAARRSALLCIGLSGAFMAVMGAGLLAGRGLLGRLFTTDPRVIRVIRELAVFAALFQVSDGLMGSSQGVLRGCGHQHLTALFNFTGFWVCGGLLGYLLCFRAGWGLRGLWAGISAGDTATCGLNLGAVGCMRWGREAERAVARSKALAEQQEGLLTMLGPDASSSASASSGPTPSTPTTAFSSAAAPSGNNSGNSSAGDSSCSSSAGRPRGSGGDSGSSGALTRLALQLQGWWRRRKEGDGGGGGSSSSSSSGGGAQLELLP
ncbi:hypothetical protein Agub_g13458 [Astrephomene gubernaculifera]|uniref:Protein DETOXIFICATION n=1 Tax=Astrephomene gubernaculifera TaxID=47775 RepID=A0AAD3HSD8_9CHLO|nr:hypothetical protein Agub_g13458 [Astrephomene gubernaculifera]